MMIPLFHLDINIKLLALPNLSVLFQIRYTRNMRAAKDTCFATLVYCWKEHFELPNGALFSCKSHFAVVSCCITLQASMISHQKMNVSFPTFQPPWKGCFMSVPRKVYIILIRQWYNHPSFYVPLATTVLEAVDVSRQRTDVKCGHLGSILLVKSQFMGSKPNTSTKTYSVVFHPHLYLQIPKMFGHLRRLPTPTRPCMLRATCRRQDDTHCCQATCIDFDTHSFCLLTQPTTKLSQGNDVVALSTSKRTPKEIETSKNEKHVETLDQLGLEPQGTR